MKSLKIVVEKHADGYVAYPLGFKGVVVGEGESYEQALADCQSAIRFHIETFGPESIDRLIEDLHASDSETEAAWKVQIDRRIEEIQSGKVQGIPGEEISARILTNRGGRTL